MIGKVERFLDKRIEVDGLLVAPAAARMREHALDDVVGALAVRNDPLEIVGQRFDDLVDFAASFFVEGRDGRRGRLLQFVQQPDRKPGEIVDEVERVLDLVRDAGRELAERGEFLGLDQPILRLAQIVERGGELARARLHLLEQACVLDRDHGLVGECAQDLDMARGKDAGLGARDDDGAQDLVLAEQRHAEQRARRAAGRREGNDVIGLRQHVLDLLDAARENGAPRDRAARRRDERMILQIALEHGGRLGSGHPAVAERLAVAHAQGSRRRLA